MRLSFFVSLLAIFSILSVMLLGGADAACINAKIAKAVYLPYETVQVQIDTNAITDLRETDLFLIRNNANLPTEFFLTKVSSNQYFAWFDLPASDGNYVFKARATCQEGLIVSSVNFKVEKTIASLYDILKGAITDWLKLSVDEHIVAAGALSHDPVSEEALSAFVYRQDSCVNRECSTKQKALTLMAFDDNLIRQKMQDELEANQNYLRGLWILQVNSSGAQTCTLSLGNETNNVAIASGTNNLNLDFTNVLTWAAIDTRIECPQDTSAKIIVSYKGVKKNVNMTRYGNLWSVIIMNEGCWGAGFKGSCDNDATVYALLALSRTSRLNASDSAIINAVYWLTKNGQGIRERALVYHLTHDLNALSDVMGSQSSAGWWPKNSSSYKSDIESSAVAVYALKSSVTNESSSAVLNAIDRGERWLIDNSSTANLYNRSLILFIAFSSKDIQPQLTIWPGFVKTQSQGSFDFILNNKGQNRINVDTTLLNSTSDLGLEPREMKSVHFNIPLITTTDGRALAENLNIRYTTSVSQNFYEYNVPVLIFTQKSSQEQVNGTINASEITINKTKQQEIINETQGKETENKTTEDVSLFKFKERIVDKDAKTGETSSFTLTLMNKLSDKVEDVSITYDSSLIGAVSRIEPSFINEIDSGDDETITVYLKPTSARVYDGDIIAEATYGEEEIKARSSLTVNASQVSGGEVEKSCGELGGKICKDDESCTGIVRSAADTFQCCVGDCKKKEAPGRNIAILLVILAVIILVIVFLILRRRPKKEMKEFLKETTEQYEKRFQRPAGITRV